ncbi:MAG TPA: delta-60 repeat domain-containing protein [Blastocatellia bacterium]
MKDSPTNAGIKRGNRRIWNHLVRTTRLTPVITVLLILVLAGRQYGSAQTTPQPGDLDPTFGTGGKVTTEFNGLGDGINSVAIQSDGKIVAGGFATSATTGLDFALARYNTDGSLDTTFGTGGKVTTDFFGGTDAISGIVIQPDGLIVVCGYAFEVTPPQTPEVSNFALARYNVDGTLDSTFGTGGKVTTGFSGSIDQGFGLALQSNGQIVVAGKAEFPTTMDDFALARYNADGSLDTTFGSGGKVTTDFFGGQDTAFGVVIQSDGAIVAGGEEENLAGTEGEFALARYDTNGSLDSSFGSAGKVTTSFFGNFDEVLDLALQSNGQIVAGGFDSTDAAPMVSFNFSPSNNFALARYNSDGSLDSTFGTGGKVTTDVGSMDRAVGLAIQTNGDLVAGGLSFNSSSTMEFALARYTTSGALDTTFGTGGEVTTEFDGFGDKILRVAIDASGNIVAGGSSTQPSAAGITEPGKTAFALARYIGTAPAPPPPQPNFSLSFAESSVSIARGKKDTVQLNVTRTGGFTGEVTITGPSPAVKGLKATNVPLSISGSSGNVTIKVKSGAAEGTDQLTFTGTDSTGKIVQTATLSVTVTK